jgi:hypothetical protein
MALLGGNILANIPLIERIVSAGHSTPQGYFYDQDRAEWVLVLQGSAKVLFEGEPEPKLLGRGTTRISLRTCGIASNGVLPTSRPSGSPSIGSRMPEERDRRFPWQRGTPFEGTTP